jgi:hypothetical protein
MVSPVWIPTTRRNPQLKTCLHKALYLVNCVYIPTDTTQSRKDVRRIYQRYMSSRDHNSHHQLPPLGDPNHRRQLKHICPEAREFLNTPITTPILATYALPLQYEIEYRIRLMEAAERLLRQMGIEDNMCSIDNWSLDCHDYWHRANIRGGSDLHW